ncbi:alpha/beta hydrolase [Paenibacillus sp. TRM 82003]|nr:alpha/beta hydrolase [Paenibacillus sp. TRM 82003]
MAEQLTMSIPFEYEVGTDRVIRGDVHLTRAERAPEATVVIVHGFKGFKDWGMFPYVAERLAETFDVVRINLSRNGVGASLVDFDELEKFGRQTFSGDLDDIGSVVDRIRGGALPLGAGAQRQPSAERIVLLGHSRGGGEAIVFALDRPDAIAGVVSWNGSTRFESMFGDAALRAMREEGVAYIDNARTKQRMPLTREIADDLDTNRERFDIGGRVPALATPLVLIQGTADHKSLLQGSERLTNVNPSIPWVRIEGGDHTFGAKHPFEGTTAPLEAALAATVQAILSMEV